jgi:hypothetical protein
MLGPDRADITSGHVDPEKSPQYDTSFRVNRVAGHWAIDESSISQMQRRIIPESEWPEGMRRLRPDEY